MAKFNSSQYLPLTEPTYYIMLSLAEELHGYAIMRKVEQISNSAVKLGPGTLYGALAQLEKEGLISRVRQEKRRKLYLLTIKGRLVLNDQIERLEVMVKNAQDIRAQI